MQLTNFLKHHFPELTENKELLFVSYNRKFLQEYDRIISAKEDIDIQDKEVLILEEFYSESIVELAKALNAKGAKAVYLYVTHGIFSKGFEELNKYIDHIYTTNSFPHDLATMVTGGAKGLTEVRVV